MPKKLTPQDFIDRAQAVHGDKYDYSNTVYINKRTEMSIICPIHGDFVQLAATHIRGSGCQKCGLDISIKSTLKTHEKFLTQAKNFHDDKYDYSKTEYIHSMEKVTITCPVHGDFQQTPDCHIKYGCEKCASMMKIRKSADSFISRAHKVHGDKYDYSEFKYIKANIKGVIICPEHGAFMQSSQSHISWGNGCPLCADYGFKAEEPAILYYLRVETRNQLVYKIGITNRRIEDRYENGDMEKITILKQYQYDIGQDARNREQEILKEFSEYLYEGEAILSNGNTELFNHDILMLDNIVA